MHLDDLKKMYGLEVYYPGHVFRQFARRFDGHVVFNPAVPTETGATSIVLRSFDDGQLHLGVAIPPGGRPFYKRRSIESQKTPGQLTHMWFLVGYELDGNRLIEGIDAVTREVVSLVEPMATTEGNESNI